MLNGNEYCPTVLDKAPDRLDRLDRLDRPSKGLD